MASAFTKTVRKGKLTFTFRASPVTNIAYALDAMSGLLHTPAEAFLQRWRDDPPGLTRKDQLELDRWRTTQARHIHSVSIDDDDTYPLDYPLPHHHEIQLGKRLRIASFEADDLDDYRRLLSVITTPKHVETLVEVAAHFLKRYMRWWDDLLGGAAQRFVRQFEATLEELGLFLFIDDVARFYEAEPAATQALRFHFVLRTDRNGQGLHGEQIENHSVVELFPSQVPSGRVDVVLHEVFHYFFASAPRHKHKALLRAFAEAREGFAWGAYNLLDEAVAAALGNGLVGRATRTKEAFAAYLQEDGSLYGHPAVDSAAKALMPVLEKRILSGRGTLHERFVPGYLETVARAVGEAVHKPSFLLWTMSLVSDRATMAPMVGRFIAAVRARSVYEQSPIDSPSAGRMLERHTDLSGAVFVRAGEIRRLEGFAGLVDERVLADLEAASRAQEGLVYGLRRSAKAFVFVFVARSDAGFEAAIQTFLDAPAPFEGTLGCLP